MKKYAPMLLFCGFFMSSITSIAQETWVVDPAHSSVQFSVTHLLISDVSGQFKSFNGTVSMKEKDFTTAQIEGQVTVSTINTGNGQRDDHLMSAAFFDASNHPNITFKSKEITKKSDSKYLVTGDLTIKGVSKMVQLDVEYMGTIDFMGQTKAGLKATATINRFDYGLNWNAMLETGGAVVGKEVEITLNIELVKK